MTEGDFPEWHCSSCDATFDPWDGSVDLDDMHCPECDSQDIHPDGDE